MTVYSRNGEYAERPHELHHDRFSSGADTGLFHRTEPDSPQLIFRDGLWLALLALYILAGTHLVPFHGDESTTLWMSRDYGYSVMFGDWNRVQYRQSAPNPTEQHMRLITGSLTKLAMGFSWHINGLAPSDINEQWDWGADWNYNWSTGHAPDDSLLMMGRWPSALMLAAGAVVIFLIGRAIDGRTVAYVASLYYALNPALLLNGRRAMFEGGLVLFSLLGVLAAIWVLDKRHWWSAVALGIATGLAVSAKHPAVFTAVPVFVYLFIVAPALRLKLVMAGLLSLAVFYLLNPIWWGDPVQRVGQVLEARQDILDGQVAAFGGYDGPLDQTAGFLRQALLVLPQYYEVPAWADYIRDQIDRYETSPLRGVSIGGSVIGGILLAGLALWGGWRLWRGGDHRRRLIVVWTVTLLLFSWWLTPLEWQRYYLMVYPPLGLLAGVGLSST